MAELKLPHLNSVLLAGRLVEDPHPLEAQGGRPGASFTLAVNRYLKGKSPVATYVDCVVWGPTAESVNACCAKGSAVLVVGSLAQYERKQAKGPPRKVTQVSVVTVQFLDRRSVETARTAALPEAAAGGTVS